MDLYDTSTVSDRDARATLTHLAVRYEAVLKFFGAMLLAIGAGFGLRFVFENELGQVFGAMLVWFSLIFGVLGLLFVGLFWVRGRVADYRRGA